MRVQMQFENNGEYAAKVSAWLEECFPCSESSATTCPGLVVSVVFPDNASDRWESWPARLVASLGPLDVAIEVIARCFDDLAIPPCKVVSLHLTRA